MGILEFDLIKRIQAACDESASKTEGGVVLGIGDDAAILQTLADQSLVVSTDTLVSGVHFLPTDPASSIGHKALAVNLSDLAAMGATPKWITLNLTLPDWNPQWTDDFIAGFVALLKRHHVALVGGDTTRGPLSITVTAMGEAKRCVKRSGAQAGDLIAVSGQLGSAAFALHNPGINADCSTQLHRPNPRLDLVPALRPLATAMIDVSDGLVPDLGHICQASGLGAVLDVDAIPFNPVIQQDPNWLHYVLAGGDDYELCFTLPAAMKSALPSGCTVIGHTIINDGTVETDIRLRQDGLPFEFQPKGFQHFSHET